MLRVPMIILSIFSLRIVLMFVIQLNSSLKLVLLLICGTSGSFEGNSVIFLLITCTFPWFGCQSVKVLFLLLKVKFFKYCKKLLDNMFVHSFVRWTSSRYSIALAIALLQIKIKPCSKHRVLNKLFTFFITSLTSWVFLTKIDNMAVLLTPYDLYIFPESIILCTRYSTSTLICLNLSISC